MVKFSIVIPIYNSETTLERCINSTIQQTYKNIEIILVNDGSLDGSLEVCKCFANHDQIKVIDKKNGGVSSARNVGIMEASGDYILFLDADDYFESDMCEALNEVITVRKYPDCLDFGINYVTSSGETHATVNQLEKNTLLNKEYLDNKIIPSLLNLKDDSEHNIWEFVCNKAFKLDIIKKNGIVFDESRRIWEDKPFLLNYLRYCKTYYSLDNCYYYYVNTSGSLSRKFDLNFFNIIIANYCMYRQWYGKQFDFDTPYVNEYWCKSIENMIFRFLEQKENKELLENTIIAALKNSFVQLWYSMRVPINKKEKTANELMRKKDFKAVINFYRNWLKEEKVRKKTTSFLNRMATVKKVSNRMFGKSK